MSYFEKKKKKQEISAFLTCLLSDCGQYCECVSVFSLLINYTELHNIQGTKSAVLHPCSLSKAQRQSTRLSFTFSLICQVPLIIAERSHYDGYFRIHKENEGEKPPPSPLSIPVQYQPLYFLMPASNTNLPTIF